MSLHLDERADGGFAFYIDGDLQFDTADEALYHESMALPALSLALPERPEGLRALIGGGDGLALRECLRFPGIARVDLVDRDPEVVTRGRTRFAGLNQHAFEDGRVTVHRADAGEFLAEAPVYRVSSR
jgi:spermidine synthase